MKFSVTLSSLAALVSVFEPSLAAWAETGLYKRAPAMVYTKCTKPNIVALTFDDGPYIYQTDLVNLLNQNGIKATFFVNGNNYRCIYDAGQVTSLKNAFNAGHMIASHTWAHLNLATLSWDQIHDEMWRVELAMSKILGVKPAFMRPPYGSYNGLVRDASSIRNQSLVIWDFDSGDSLGVSPDESKQRYQNVVNQHPGTILTLNHETIETTATNVMPFAIQKLQDAGYQFDTVAGCLGLAPYASFNPPGTRDSTWHC